MTAGQVLIDGTDVTDLFDLEPFEAVEQATRLNGTFFGILRDESAVDGSTGFTPVENMTLVCKVGGVTYFDGHVAHLTRELEGLTKVYVVRGQTNEALLDRRVIDRGKRTAARSDADDVAWLLTKVADLGFTAGSVATLDASMEDMDYSGMSVRGALDLLAAAVGAVYWVSGLALYWKRPKPVGVTQTAPWGLSLEPNGTTTFAPDYWSEPSDATAIINRMLVRGKDGASWWFDHAASQTFFDGEVFEGVHTDLGVATEARAQKIADAYFRRYAYPLATAAYRTRQVGVRAGHVQRVQVQPFGIDRYDYVASTTVRFVGAGEMDIEVRYGEPDLTLPSYLAASGGGGGSGGPGGSGGNCCGPPNCTPIDLAALVCEEELDSGWEELSTTATGAATVAPFGVSVAPTGGATAVATWAGYREGSWGAGTFAVACDLDSSAESSTPAGQGAMVALVLYPASGGSIRAEVHEGDGFPHDWGGGPYHARIETVEYELAAKPTALSVAVVQNGPNIDWTAKVNGVTVATGTETGRSLPIDQVSVIVDARDTALGTSDYSASASVARVTLAPADNTECVAGLPSGTPIRETAVGAGDGVDTTFSTLSPFIAGTLQVWVDGIVQYPASEDGAAGTFTLGFAPATGEAVTASWNVL